MEAEPSRALAPGADPASALARALVRVHARMTRLVWVHGLSTVLGATAALLLLDFLVDWSLHVPRGVRWVHLLCLGALPAWLAVRALIRPLRARPDRTACAVLLERAHPELRQLLVTAAELERRPTAAGEPEIAAAIRADAGRAVAHVDLSRALDASGPRLRFFVGTLSTALCAGILLAHPQSARVFFVRLFGGDAAWPQRTHLSIEIASAGTAPSPPPAPGEPLEVRVARGSDVPVVVRAEGVVPDEITLHFSSGQRAVVAASGGGTFRTLLRSVQESFQMFATGGDDEDDDPTVRMIVLRPPEVVGLAIDIEPPAYSGLRPETREGGDAEVLAGSRLQVHVLGDPPDAKGRARLLPEDRVVELSAAPFPRAATAGTPAETVPGLAFPLTPEKSLRYRVELVDSSLLENPEPGLFAITVVEDRPPEVEILAPGRGDYDTVPGGSLSLRARARDDFGIVRMTYSVAPVGGGGGVEAAGTPAAAERELEWRTIPPEERTDGDRAADKTSDRAGASLRSSPGTFRVVARARARLEVADLAGPAGATPGAQLEVVVSAADNHEPGPHVGRSSSVRVRVVTADEFLRRLQDRLGRARAAASALSELQRGKQRRTQELAAGLEGDAVLTGDTGDEIFATATGERRVEGDARALSRDLCSALEGVLYARVDERGGPLLERVDAKLSASDRTFDPEAWRSLAEEEKAISGAPSGLADRLLRIAGLALEVSEVDAPAATAALARAQDATEPARVHSELALAADSQKAVVDKLENLLERLAEWDNYQSVLSLTRDILNGQKTLQERTKNFAKDH